NPTRRSSWLVVLNINAPSGRPSPNMPGCMTLSLVVPVFFVAELPKPTFYRLPCGSHADNFT
ncbi:hypothetical protein, partial [Enterobacter intestinihominis]